MGTDRTVEWLMEGDPSIRWQVMRDISGTPEMEWKRERSRIPEAGWGKRFLESLDGEGNWPESRWTGTIWTLLILMDLGFPAEHPQVAKAAQKLICQFLTSEHLADSKWIKTRIDLCHLGFWIRIGSYFGYDRELLSQACDVALNAQMADGGWNCAIRRKPITVHSSFHTTFNQLEGLSQAAQVGVLDGDRFKAAESRAMEFMAAHQMYRSDKTGQVISERFTHLSFPSHWHYTVLRGLDYVAKTAFRGDDRLQDPVELLESRRKANGRWPVEKRIPGESLFDMEKLGGDSRWNTLRAMRVLGARSTALMQ